MISMQTLKTTLTRYQPLIDAELRNTVQKVVNASTSDALHPFYGQMQYHLGWVDAALQPTKSNPGKLLRPTLLLLAYELAGSAQTSGESQTDETYLRRALPAAIAVELTHNFTLIHDDIEDGDTERRHRPTLWKIWDVPQAINTGDGMFALARLALWGVLEHGATSTTAVQTCSMLDRAVLTIAEGQYLDISFETRQDISVAMYIDMIQRKTAALMGCAAAMGARLSTEDQEIITRLHNFGLALGIAFQVRDDLLGVWASTAELGKTPAGDIYRRKKSLPILHALEHASREDKEQLHTIYGQESSITQQQAETILAIFARTETESYCREFLHHHCQLAREALAAVPHHNTPSAIRARHDLQTMVEFLEQPL